jgi:acyl-CoA thioesterase II
MILFFIFKLFQIILIKIINNFYKNKELDVDLYQSVNLWKPVDSRGVFGGQVVGLALSAAIKTVQPDYQVHSLHSYFILPGDNLLPILYHIKRIRDGKSFVTRSVFAKQKGKVIFTCVISFQLPEPSKLIHQFSMPIVPPPESVRTTEERLLGLLQDPKIPAKYHRSIQMRLEQPIAIDLRRIHPKKLHLENKEPRQYVWMKAKGNLSNDLSIHQCVAAYCSDHYLLYTTLEPHDLKAFGGLKMIASLDHAMVST